MSLKCTILEETMPQKLVDLVQNINDYPES